MRVPGWTRSRSRPRPRVWQGGVGAPRMVALEWDGRDAGGRRAPQGLYLARLEAGTPRPGTRILVLRWRLARRPIPR